MGEFLCWILPRLLSTFGHPNFPSCYLPHTLPLISQSPSPCLLLTHPTSLSHHFLSHSSWIWPGTTCLGGCKGLEGPGPGTVPLLRWWFPIFYSSRLPWEYDSQSQVKYLVCPFKIRIVCNYVIWCLCAGTMQGLVAQHDHGKFGHEVSESQTFPQGSDPLTRPPLAWFRFNFLINKNHNIWLSF